MIFLNVRVPCLVGASRSSTGLLSLIPIAAADSPQSCEISSATKEVRGEISAEGEEKCEDCMCTEKNSFN